MYRRLLIGVLVFIAGPNLARAERKYGMAGCGPGSLAMGTTGPQFFAATTNHSSTLQVYALTSGTSNCTPDTRSNADALQEIFMFNNYATLSREMTRGNGESLRGLAEVLGCRPDITFNTFAQEQARHVFSAPGAVAALRTFKESIAMNETIAKNCDFVASRRNEESNQ